jgi:SAM-dependent methyltransferase
MPATPESRARPADPPRVNDYDSFAGAYTAENESSLWNAYYERPAMLALAGDVAGRRILNAGCGSGPLFAALRDRGGIVTGFDSSTELRRVLKPGGRLILSVNHPFDTRHPGLAGRKTDYFATYNWTEEWTMGDQSVLMSFWERPLHAMTDAFTTAGFRICVLSEPPPVPEARELFPEEFRMITTSPGFLFFVLHAG